VVALVVLVIALVADVALIAAWVVDCNPRLTCANENKLIPLAIAIDNTLFIDFINLDFRV
jgi:acyl CoA:acetate/3-ketoacid CoA transferase alpha subunit